MPNVRSLNFRIISTCLLFFKCIWTIILFCIEVRMIKVWFFIPSTNSSKQSNFYGRILEGEFNFCDHKPLNWGLIDQKSWIFFVEIEYKARILYSFFLSLLILIFSRRFQSMASGKIELVPCLGFIFNGVIFCVY